MLFSAGQITTKNELQPSSADYKIVQRDQLWARIRKSEPRMSLFEPLFIQRGSMVAQLVVTYKRLLLAPTCQPVELSLLDIYFHVECEFIRPFLIYCQGESTWPQWDYKVNVFSIYLRIILNSGGFACPRQVLIQQILVKRVRKVFPILLWFYPSLEFWKWNVAVSFFPLYSCFYCAVYSWIPVKINLESKTIRQFAGLLFKVC